MLDLPGQSGEKTQKTEGREHVRLDLKPENLPTDHNLWKSQSSLKRFGMHQQEVTIVEEQR